MQQQQQQQQQQQGKARQGKARQGKARQGGSKWRCIHCNSVSDRTFTDFIKARRQRQKQQSGSKSTIPYLAATVRFNPNMLRLAGQI